MNARAWIFRVVAAAAVVAIVLFPRVSESLQRITLNEDKLPGTVAFQNRDNEFSENSTFETRVNFDAADDTVPMYVKSGIMVETLNVEFVGGFRASEMAEATDNIALLSRSPQHFSGDLNSFSGEIRVGDNTTCEAFAASLISDPAFVCLQSVNGALLELHALNSDSRAVGLFHAGVDAGLFVGGATVDTTENHFGFYVTPDGTIGSLGLAGYVSHLGGWSLSSAGDLTTSLGLRLYVEGKAGISDDLTLDADLNVAGSETVGVDLAVAGSSRLTGDLRVNGLTTLGDLNANGTTNQLGALFVQTDFWSTGTNSVFSVLTPAAWFQGGATFGNILNSTVSTGTAPFIIQSTTKVVNLHADNLDDGDYVSRIIAGNGMSISPTSGTGDVTITNAITGVGYLSGWNPWTGTNIWSGTNRFDSAVGVTGAVTILGTLGLNTFTPLSTFETAGALLDIGREATTSEITLHTSSSSMECYLAAGADGLVIGVGNAGVANSAKHDIRLRTTDTTVGPTPQDRFIVSSTGLLAVGSSEAVLTTAAGASTGYLNIRGSLPALSQTDVVSAGPQQYTQAVSRSGTVGQGVTYSICNSSLGTGNDFFWRNTSVNNATATLQRMMLNEAGGLTVGGSDLATVNWLLYVNGAAKIAGIFETTGASKLGTTLVVNGATTLDTTLGVTGAVTLKSTFTVAGIATMFSAVGVNTYTPRCDAETENSLVDIGVDGATNVLALHSSASSLECALVNTGAGGLIIEASRHATAAGNNRIVFKTEESDAQATPTTRAIIGDTGGVALGPTYNCASGEILHAAGDIACDGNIKFRTETLNGVSGSLTINATQYANSIVNFTGSVTAWAINSEGLSAGTRHLILFKQDGTGNRRLQNPASNIKLATGEQFSAVVHAANTADAAWFLYDGATWWQVSETDELGP